jgi:hypothetical protein
MSKATFRFYSELNDFLPLDQKQVLFTHAFSGRPAIKDTIEALGVPHTEVDLILANGVSVDFSYRLQDGDQISVYPVFESMDISPLVHLRPEPLREVRFVVDTHLGRLAGYLRMVGFDALYRNDFADDELARISSHQSRILLTKDRGLLKRSKVTHGYFVREIHPRAQLIEVLRRFDLVGLITPFQRCMRCNGLVIPVPKEDILDQLPLRTRQEHDAFQRCEGCGRVYWRGSHYRRMQQLITQVVEEAQRR